MRLHSIEKRYALNPNPASRSRSCSYNSQWLHASPDGSAHTEFGLVLPRPPVVVPVAAFDLVGGRRRAPYESVRKALS